MEIIPAQKNIKSLESWQEYFIFRTDISDVYTMRWMLLGSSSIYLFTKSNGASSRLELCMRTN